MPREGTESTFVLPVAARDELPGNRYRKARHADHDCSAAAGFTWPVSTRGYVDSLFVRFCAAMKPLAIALCSELMVAASCLPRVASSIWAAERCR